MRPGAPELLNPATPEPGPANVTPCTPLSPEAVPLLSPYTPTAVEEPVTPRLAVIAPAEKLPVESRFTMAFAVAALVGATFQFKPRVPVDVTGDPLTVKSEVGALSPTLVTPPPPPPGKVCPAAKVMMPVSAIFNPVSFGAPVPEPARKFKVPE